MTESIDIISILADKIAETIKVKQETVKVNSCKIKYFSVAEVCEMLKISKATFYRHKDQGFIKPAVHVGRKPLFTQQSIDEYLAHFC